MSSFPCTANFSFLPSGRKLEAAAYNEPSHAQKGGSLNHRSMCNFLLAVKGEGTREKPPLSLKGAPSFYPLCIHCVSTVVHLLPRSTQLWNSFPRADSATRYRALKLKACSCLPRGGGNAACRRIVSSLLSARLFSREIPRTRDE